VDGQWTDSGRPVDGQWTASGRTVDGQWTDSGRTVDGQWTDGRTDATKLIVAFLNFVNTDKNDVANYMVRLEQTNTLLHPKNALVERNCRRLGWGSDWTQAVIH